MIEQFSHIGLTILFCVILLLPFWIKKYKILKQYSKIFVYIVLIAIPWVIVTDIIAINNGIWYFSENKVLGIWLYEMPIDDLILMVAVSIVITAVTLVLVEWKY